MDEKRAVACTIVFTYDSDTYLWDDEDDNPPSQEEIFRRCREMMMEDLTNFQNPFPADAIDARFV
jgi:hypothetical protein